MLKTLQPHIKRIHNQQNVGCCASCAVVLSLEILHNMKSKEEYFSSLFLYYFSRKKQDRIYQHGTSIIDNLDILKNIGVSREYFWPFSKSRIDIEPSKDAIVDATNFRINSYRETNVSEFKQYIDNNIPVVSAIKTGKLFWKLASSINLHDYRPINDYDNRESFSHAITIIGYDDNLNNGSWIIVNSVGNKWGDNGIAAIPYSCNENIYESFVITDF
jgi:C1A family cysteine protease